MPAQRRATRTPLLADFEFRYHHRERIGFNDGEGSEQALRGIVG